MALLATLVCVALLVGGCGRDGARGPSTDAEGALRGYARTPTPNVATLSTTEVGADGRTKTFRFRAEPRGLLFVYFGYTNCPDVCPTTLSDLRAARRRLGTDGTRVALAFMTVDPRRDTGPVLVPFLDSFVPGAHALRTTDAANLRAVEAAFGASSSVTRSAGSYEVSHSGGSYVVDSAGDLVDEFGFGVGPATMAHDLGILLRRAGR